MRLHRDEEIGEDPMVGDHKQSRGRTSREQPEPGYPYLRPVFGAKHVESGHVRDLPDDVVEQILSSLESSRTP